jgi:hypothetical protein
MKVWVVIYFCYEDHQIEGVYTSRERAIEDYPLVDEHGFSTGIEITEAEVVD